MRAAVAVHLHSACSCLCCVAARMRLMRRLADAWWRRRRPSTCRGRRRCWRSVALAFSWTWAAAWCSGVRLHQLSSVSAEHSMHACWLQVRRPPSMRCTRTHMPLLLAATCPIIRTPSEDGRRSRRARVHPARSSRQVCCTPQSSACCCFSIAALPRECRACSCSLRGPFCNANAMH